MLLFCKSFYEPDYSDDRIPETPPVIAPVPDHIQRPLWSVMIPTYNCITYLRETLECVLAQDPGPELMQIEVVDDYSTDGDVAALVKEVGKGRIGYFRQEKNRGSLRNFETCLNRSKGHWVHLLHGDDHVKAGFYQEIKYLFNANPEIGAAFTKCSIMNEDGYEIRIMRDVIDKPGIIKDWLYLIAQEQLVQPPSMVIKRSVYEHLGGFFAVHYGEDWEMWARIAAHYAVAYSPKCLATYRVHNNNISTRSILSGQNIKDILKVIDIIQEYLPKEKRKEIKKTALKSFSVYNARASNIVYDNIKDKKAALRQATGALKMDQNIITFYIVSKPFVTLLQEGTKDILRGKLFKKGYKAPSLV